MVEVIERTCALVAMRPGRDAVLAEALAGLGLAVPAMGRFAEGRGVLLARVAPRQMLAMRAGVDGVLMETLGGVAEVAGVIDLSDARAAFRVAGEDARDRLALLVPLDLDDDRFPPGSCAATLLAHTSVLVLRHGTGLFELQCGRSFAGTVQDAVDSARAIA